MVINNIPIVDESLVMEKNGELVALVKFQDNVLNWNQESEDQFFEKVDNLKKSVMEFVNKTVGKHSKINKVEAMKEPFEKSATQKIRRFKYNGSTDTSNDTDKNVENKEADGDKA